jgi:hypothetical protein
MHWLIPAGPARRRGNPAAAQTPPCGTHPLPPAGPGARGLCGSAARPLDPAAPAARRSTCTTPCCRRWRATASPTRCSSLPAAPARARMDLAGSVSRCWRGLANRRDIVLVDQRGTGRSAPLQVASRARTDAPLAEAADLNAHDAAACSACAPSAAEKLPHGTCATTRRVAMQDADAVRQALGAAQHQPRRRQLRHARRAGVHAAVSAGRAPRGDRRRGAAGHGAAGLLFHRQPGRAGRR